MSRRGCRTSNGTAERPVRIRDETGVDVVARRLVAETPGLARGEPRPRVDHGERRRAADRGLHLRTRTSGARSAHICGSTRGRHPRAAIGAIGVSCRKLSHRHTLPITTSRTLRPRGARRTRGTGRTGRACGPGRSLWTCGIRWSGGPCCTDRDHGFIGVADAVADLHAQHVVARAQSARKRDNELSRRLRNDGKGPERPQQYNCSSRRKVGAFDRQHRRCRRRLED